VAGGVVLVCAHARWLTLAQVVACVEDGVGARAALHRADELGRGRFPLLLAVTLLPFLALVMAGPSELGIEALGLEPNRVAIRELSYLAGIALFLYVRPAFAAAAYGIVVAPAPKEDL
jgi:hypothetical protein